LKALETDGFNAKPLDFEGGGSFRFATAQTNDRLDLVFKPAAESIKSEVMPLFHAAAQRAKKNHCGFRVLPMAQEPTQIQQGVELLRQDGF
jgi:hypothetical protein